MFFKKVEIPKKEINHAYQEFIEDDSIILLCVDELINFDFTHIKGAQNFPIRIIESKHEQLPKDAIYYIYAYNAAISEKACKKLIKLGYTCYDLGSIMNFKGPQESYKKGKRK